MNDISKKTVTVTIRRRSDLERRFDSAVDRLMEPAKRLNQSILVTRSSQRHFAVSLSENVPYGMTIETLNW